jgi:hypothetical protein
MSEDRLQYLIMRCVSCGGFMTKPEIIARWEEMEAAGDGQKSLCPCGSRQLRPGNITPEEEKQYNTWWQWFRHSILRRDDDGTRLWKLYYKCIKGKDLGPSYDV